MVKTACNFWTLWSLLLLLFSFTFVHYHFLELWLELNIWAQFQSLLCREEPHTHEEKEYCCSYCFSLSVYAHKKVYILLWTSNVETYFIRLLTWFPFFFPLLYFKNVIASCILS